MVVLGPILVIEGLVYEGREDTVVVLILWGGVVTRDERRDDLYDGRGVKVETATLLLGLEMGFGWGVWGG